MAKELKYDIPNFIGGLHEEVDYSLLKNNEASSLQNVNIDDGVLKTSKVPGIYLSSIPGIPKAVMTYYKDNTPYLMCIINGHLYKYDGVTWADLGGGLDVNASVYDYINDNIQSSDVFVFTNGIDNVKIYEGGSSFRDLKKLGRTSTPDPISNTIKGKYMVLHNERLWIATDNEIIASTSDRKGFDIEDYTTPTDVTEVNMHGYNDPMYTNDGTKVIGMSVVFDDIVIWKERSIHKIFGSDPSNYQKISFSAKGGISDKSIAVHESGAYFIDRNGIYFYNGSQVNLISNPIKNTWKALDIEDLKKAVGFIYNDKYILSVADIVIEYDIINKNFVINRGYKAEAVTDYKNKLLITQGDTNIYEYAVHDINNSAFWESGYSDWGLPEATKEISSIYFTGMGNGPVRITVFTDVGIPKSYTQTLDNTERVYAINYTTRGRLLKIRIENVGNSIFTVKGFKLLYELDYD